MSSVFCDRLACCTPPFALKKLLPAISPFKPAGRPLWIVVFSLMLVLRVVYAFHFRVDTDELQHLHVVWGWANGHLQYRDIFDNHGAIFHLLFTPLFRFLGERADILIPMRLAMIPLVGICWWCIYRIGTSLFSREVGLWAAALTGLYPEFFLTSTEFRTDVLWTVLWLLALVVATRKPFKTKHAFLMGLILGAAFGITVKTGLMIGSLVATTGVLMGWEWLGGRRPALASAAIKVLAGLYGLALVPGALLLFFAAQGAAREFLYCNIGHNLVPHAQNWEHFDAHVVWFPIFALILLGITPLFRNRPFDSLTGQRIGLVLIAGFYFTALKTFFPTLSRQDDLPVIPLAMLLVASAPFVLSGRFSSRPRLNAFLPWSVPSLVLLELVALIGFTPFWKNRTREEIATVADVLRATDRNDLVMDATGETIFRMRPYYYALEAFTKVRIQLGLLPDEISERLMETGTGLVRPMDLTKKAQTFIGKNYLPVGHELRMAGQKLKLSGPPTQRSAQFSIAVPTRYTILTPDNREAVGELDGTPFTGPRELAAGSHIFTAKGNAPKYIVVFWGQGFERGFTPSLKR